MGANDLKASLSLNATKWEEGIARAEAKTAAFANKVQGDFSKKLGKLFGAGALASVLYQPFHRMMSALTEKPFERAAEIKKGAADLRVTAEEFQLIEAAARASNKTVDEWVRSVHESKNPLAQTISHLEQFRAQLELTNEQVATLAHTRTFWDNFFQSVAKWSARKLTGFSEFIENFATFRILTDAEGMSQQDAMKALKEDTANQKLNAAAEGKGGLAEALTNPKTKTERSSKGDIGINELQRIGASVAGVNPAQQALNTIVRNTEKTATGIQALAERVRKKEPVSVLDLFDAL